MKKFVKVFLFIIVLAIIVIGSIGLYVKKALPNVGPAPDISIAATPDRVQRGKYLANNVMACMDCHSKRDFSIFMGPLKPATFGAGGERFGKEIKFPGTVYSKNITPAGLRSWTDGEIFRVITTGVSKDGSAIFPLMGYLAYGTMDREDVYDVIAYLRSLPAIPSTIPDRELDFPVNILVNTFPKKASLQPKPAKSDAIAYGGYLVKIANCLECHSKVTDKGDRIAGTEWGGGREFYFPNGTFTTSANISPDMETGIGKWSKEAFVKRFTEFSDSSYVLEKLNAADYNTVMPWLMYAGMKPEDLSAIYDYLRTIKPQSNEVKKFSKS